MPPKSKNSDAIKFVPANRIDSRLREEATADRASGALPKLWPFLDEHAPDSVEPPPASKRRRDEVRAEDLLAQAESAEEEARLLLLSCGLQPTTPPVDVSARATGSTAPRQDSHVAAAAPAVSSAPASSSLGASLASQPSVLRPQLIRQVFVACDTTSISRLRSADMELFARCTGFARSSEAWAVEYGIICSDYNLNPADGIPFEVFSSSLMMNP